VLETPLASLAVDVEEISRLKKAHSDLFESSFPRATDEEEHCIEMHLPYLAQVLQASEQIESAVVVPIVVGSLTASSQAKLGSLLAEYLADPSTRVIISTDFCHWGHRFGY